MEVLRKWINNWLTLLKTQLIKLKYMDLKEPLELEVFYESENSVILQDLGVDMDNNRSDKDLRKIMIYSVNYVAPFLFDDEEAPYGSLNSGGTTFVTSLSYAGLVELVMNFLKTNK